MTVTAEADSLDDVLEENAIRLHVFIQSVGSRVKVFTLTARHDWLFGFGNREQAEKWPTYASSDVGRKNADEKKRAGKTTNCQLPYSRETCHLLFSFAGRFFFFLCGFGDKHDWKIFLPFIPR